ncbi:O-antigen ligase family protein [Planococcus sp. ANT_H30]|nr:O-antigen ligase family protein [Planococcus sp. ANT_H30]
MRPLKAVNRLHTIRLSKYDTQMALSEMKNEDNRFFTSDLLLFYMLWPILIVPKEIQFFLLLPIALMLVKKHKIYFDLLSFFLGSYVWVYVFSIVANLTTRSSEFTRILAAINSLSIWVLAIVFYLIFKNTQLPMKNFIKIGFINYLLLIAIWAVSMVIHSLTSLGALSFLGRTLYYTETFNQEVVARFVGLMDYSNLIVMFCLFFYPLYFMHVRQFTSKIVQLLFLVIGIFPLISSYSRSGYLVFGAATAIGVVYYLYKSLNREVFYFGAFLTLSVALALFYTADLNSAVRLQVEELLTAREGSNDSRTIILAESIDLTMQDSPITGMGIKDNSSTGYPLGSHSTFIGFFYKTGTLGLMLGTWLFVFINLKILLLKSTLDRKILSVFIFMMPLIFIVEDIDGANWLICLYFVFVAVLFNDSNWKT